MTHSTIVLDQIRAKLGAKVPVRIHDHKDYGFVIVRPDSTWHQQFLYLPYEREERLRQARIAANAVAISWDTWVDDKT